MCRLFILIPSPEALQPLLVLLAAEEARARMALFALAHCPETYGASLVAVTALLREGSPSLRVFAQFTLERLATAQPALIQALLTDPSPEVRACLLRAVPSAYDVAERDSEALAHALVAGASGSLGDPSADVRAAACRALGALAVSTRPSWIERALADQAIAVRLGAVDFVARTGDATALSHLVSWFEFADPPTRRALVPALERLTVLPVPELFEQAQRGPLSARLAAIRILSLSRHVDTAATLAVALQDPEPVLRREAAQSLAGSFRSGFPRVADPSVADRLLFALEQERDAGVRESVVEALAFSGDPRVPLAFTRCIPTLASHLREHAVEGLATFERLGRLRAASTRERSTS